MDSYATDGVREGYLNTRKGSAVTVVLINKLLQSFKY